MLSTAFPPDAILALLNLSGSLADIDEDPGAASDTTWLIASGNNVNTEVRASFPTPVGLLVTGAGKQKFRARVRRFSATQTGEPTARIELWHAGVLVRAGVEVTVGTADTVLSFTWNATEVPGSDGVEIKVVGTATGGSPSVRNTVEVGAVEWIAAHDTGTWESEITADAPTSWWKYDEASGTTAADSGSAGNTGTHLGGVAVGSATSKVGDKSISLDGVDDYMSASPALFGTPKSFTAHVIFQIPSGITQSPMPLWSISYKDYFNEAIDGKILDSLPLDGVMLYLEWMPANSRYRLVLSINTRTDGGAKLHESMYVSTEGHLDTAKWYMITVRYRFSTVQDDKPGAGIYVNGCLGVSHAGGQTSYYPNWHADRSLSVGRRHNPTKTVYYAQALVDEVVLFDKEVHPNRVWRHAERAGLEPTCAQPAPPPAAGRWLVGAVAIG